MAEFQASTCPLLYKAPQTEFKGLQRIVQYYQMVSNVEDDVDSIQTVADVLPE